MTILHHSTTIALWQEVVHQAEAACTLHLDEAIESYLVFLLVRYINKPEIVKQIMAQEFLNGLQANRRQHHEAMRDVGDKCLIFSGLFPHMAEQRQVKVSYYVNIGQSAYAAISSKNSDLYALLAKQFVSLMDVLQSIRNYTNNIVDLLPLQAYELWNDVGSQRALRMLKQYTPAVPIVINNGKKQ